MLYFTYFIFVLSEKIITVLVDKKGGPQLSSGQEMGPTAVFRLDRGSMTRKDKELLIYTESSNRKKS